MTTNHANDTNRTGRRARDVARLLITINVSMTVCIFLSQSVSSHGAGRAAPPRRALPPEWPQDVRDVFFEDVRSTLVGERPNYANVAVRTPTPPGTPGTRGMQSKSDAGTTSDEPGLAWSAWISAETIEDEVKQIGRRLASEVDKPGPFKGGDFRKARTSFTTLALLFGLTAQYDDDIRWKAEAAGLRDRFSRAGFNCKVGTDQSYEQAKARRTELADLIRGDRPSPSPAQSDQAWFEIVDRSPLMQRLEEALEEKLSPALSSAGDFRRKRAAVAHEAQIVAAIAHVVATDGYDYADDEFYLEYAQRLQAAAKQLTEAAEERDYDSAREAAGEMNKTCSECHEDYRS